MEVIMIIYCIPAGGTNPFHAWKRTLNKDKNIHVLDFPGRGSRMREAFIDDMPTLIEDMTNEMKKNNPQNEPYAIFGYCVGAVVGYEMCKLLKKKNEVLPEYFLTFGSAAPHSSSLMDQQGNTDSAEFHKMVAQFLSPLALASEESAIKAQNAYIKEYKKRKQGDSPITVGSVFEDISEENEFELQMMLDLLNDSMSQIMQDHRMLCTYSMNNNEIEMIQLKAKVLNGIEDSFVAEEDVLLWQDCFSNTDVISVPGDHYSIMNYPLVFVDILNSL